MDDYKHILDSEETRNWFKCAMGLIITKKGLAGFIENEINQFHQDILREVLTENNLPDGSTCKSCTTESVVPCPAKDICTNRGSGKCNFHNMPQKVCSFNICNALVRKIELEHKHAGPSWKNTDASKWCISAWELAKCFMPADGYLDVKSAKETDFNGLISVLQNCKRFDTLLSSTTDVEIKKARDIGKKIRHCVDLKIDTLSTMEHFDTLIKLLSDPVSLSENQSAVAACQQLNQLKTDTLIIIFDDIMTIVNEETEQTYKVLKDNGNREKMNSTALEQKLKTLERIGNRCSQRLSDLETLVTDQNKKITSQQDQLSVLAKKVTSQDETILDIGKEVGILYQRDNSQSDLDEKIYLQSKEIDSLDRKFTGLNRSMANTCKEVRGLKQALQSQFKIVSCLERKYGSQDENVARFSQRLTALETTSKQTEHIYNDLKIDLQIDLVKFYSDSASTLPISPLRTDLDEKLDEVYVQPKLTIVQVGKTVSLENALKGKEVLTYSDVFDIGHSKNIYIQGNPGMGKSTYSRKITLDWCKNVARRFDSQEIQEEDQSSIQGLDFEFLFLLSLRESDGGACDVMQMIINGIISQISYKHYDDDFLANVLNCERCLVILDGLDEWSHPLNGSCTKTPKHIPHRNRVGKSIYLTMTRPWKLSQISLKDSEIDVLIEISGVKETDELITKVVTCLNNNEAKTKDSKQFNKATEHLSSIKTIPIVVLQLICIWYEKNTVPESQCGIYSTMMKMLLQRKKDDGNPETQIASVVVPNCISDIQWSESEWKFLMQLGKLAFETLYPLDRKLPRLVFTDDLMCRYVNNETKGFGLSAGILTEYKIRSLNAKKSHLSFLHKTFQEFLASFYLSFQQGENLVVRMNNEGFNIDDISQMFLFLCGLKPSLAVTVFRLLMRKTSQLIYNCLVKDKQEFDIISIVHNAMNIMKSGHMESVQNGHANVRFTLTHICFANDTYNVSSTGESFTDSKIGKLETIICTEEEFNLQASSIVKLNSNTLKTIWLRKIDDHVELSECTYLQAIIIVGNTFDRPGYVDMSIDENVQNVPVYLNISKCNGLKHLVIAQPNVTMEINTDQLYSCRLRNYDLSKGNIAETLEHRSSRIRYLYLEYCSAANSAEGRRFKLDLISCSCLQKLYIAFCDFAFRIGTTNLKECELYDYDFLHGHIAEDLKNAKSLTQLTLSDCKATLGNGEKNRAFILDLTSCSSLQWIYVSWCDIAVSINTTALRECYLSGHNLTQGNLLEALSKSTELTVLKIWRCSFPETDQRHIKKVSLDMTACKNLSVLMIQNSDVIMSYNTQIVGERLITWTKPLV